MVATKTGGEINKDEISFPKNFEPKGALAFFLSTYI